MDRRHDRRSLADEEVTALLPATEAGPVRSVLPGPDRAMLYRVALLTGLRASELASLTPGSFALDTEPPTVTVQAAHSKHRREDVLPLHPALVTALRPWLAGKPPGERVWPGKWAAHKRAGEMLRMDLQAAGIPYEVGGRFADFHALRHTLHH
jgi:integrase